MKTENLARMRELLDVAPPERPDEPTATAADDEDLESVHSREGVTEGIWLTGRARGA
mgnify:CR=1 FL=1